MATFQQGELFPTVRPQTPDSFVKRLRDAVPQPVRVHFTRNRVTMISVRFDADGMAVVRLHERFLRAPVEVLDALGGYVATRDAAAWQRVADYARQIELPAADVRQHDPHAARGGTYDLDAIFHDINNPEFLKALLFAKISKSFAIPFVKPVCGCYPNISTTILINSSNIVI